MTAFWVRFSDANIHALALDLIGVPITYTVARAGDEIDGLVDRKCRRGETGCAGVGDVGRRGVILAARLVCLVDLVNDLLWRGGVVARRIPAERVADALSGGDR